VATKVEVDEHVGRCSIHYDGQARIATSGFDDDKDGVQSIGFYASTQNRHKCETCPSTYCRQYALAPFP